jgi:hypothetical protein
MPDESRLRTFREMGMDKIKPLSFDLGKGKVLQFGNGEMNRN